MKLKYILSIAVALGLSKANAKENIGTPSVTVGKTNAARGLSADCNPATAQIDLAINNVRTTILGGGDMWWDLNNARYEIPKLPEGSTEQPVHSLFAGSLWIGGVDAGGQLKVAAMTYRQSGNDFWPGPLNTSTADISADECDEWDTHFRMKRSDVDAHIAWINDPIENADYSMPASIADWPAHGSAIDGQDYYLAPFFDADGDGNYDPNAGDYPDYNASGDRGCEAQLYGDETIWWIFNDKGNIHMETGAEAIGLEIHAQGFGFATNDEINNMTFYQYKIFNRSTFTLNDTYFGQWVDPDLGNYEDDYVGCDVQRGLGYCFNGDQDDEGARGYGLNPPAIGVDFFQGPLADEADGIDNDRDGLIDEEGEQIIMSKFVYYNNDFSVTGNPETGTHIYNYLRGIFKDGTEMAYGGTGHQPSNSTTGIPCDFMFPGDSDPDFVGTGGAAVAPWSESSVGNDPADRRFLQSAGAFTLEPGAVNTITTGVVWARASQGGPEASVDLMRQADDKAQALFDNCFKVLDGPDAPTLNFSELDQQIVFSFENLETSNNYELKYEEFDPFINAAAGNNYTDTVFKFQGYQLYQFSDATVSITDIGNPDKARLIAQCDIEDGVVDLINYDIDGDIGVEVPTLMVEGANDGIFNSVLVTEDMFATGDRSLVNFKQYYYSVVAYAHNNFKTYNPADANALDGQKKPYLAGRKNIRTYIVTPRDPRVNEGGTLVQAQYGTSPKVERVSGVGNGGLTQDITDEVEDAIVNGESTSLLYDNAGSPVKITVFDPLAVPQGDFEFHMADTNGGTFNDAYWYLVHDNDTVYADTSINAHNSQIIKNWGFELLVDQTALPGNGNQEGNGFISATMEFADNSKPWLSGIEDIDGQVFSNWIRSGGVASVSGDPDAQPEWDDVEGVDDEEAYEGVLDGLMAPYALVANMDEQSPIPSISASQADIEDLNSIKVVITSDKSKWTRSLVVHIEEGSNPTKFIKATKASVDKDGNADNSGTTGLGWFPGYAIDLETGERLNIIFREFPFYEADNSNDLLWNPSSRYVTNIGELRVGGFQSFMILKETDDVPSYSDDQGATVLGLFDNPDLSDVRKNRILSESTTWVYGYPVVDQRYEFLATDVEININVTRPYGLDDAGNPPVFRFNTDDIYSTSGVDSVAGNVLEKINIVPNPYYAFSEYESNQLDNRVRLTNLPKQCEIKIFSLNGTLIRTYDKDDNSAYLDWDLKNQANIPVASGMYIIHIDVDGVGEKILKWFGVMRPVDLDTF